MLVSWFQLTCAWKSFKFYFFLELNKKYDYSIKQSKISFQRTGEFISNVIKDATLANPPSHNFDTFKISYQGEVRDLDESSVENVLNWDKVGVYPGV